MGFLNSLPLWTGLVAAGVAVPIVIHLLYRKHRKQTDWAAMELLRRAMVIRSGQVKLEDYLILFLRCLAIVLIGAALLRPTLQSDSVQWLGENRVGMVVAVDASYSMNHGEHSRFEKAVAKTREILDMAQQGDPVSLVLMSNRPEIVLRRTSYDKAAFDDVLDHLKETTPYRLSLQRNLEQLDELVAELKTPASECYLITDGQEIDWGALSDSGRQALERLTSKASVFIVPIPADGEENVTMTRLAYSFGSLQKLGDARFHVEVRNQGRRESPGGAVEFRIGREGVDEQDYEKIEKQAFGALKPGGVHIVEFRPPMAALGTIRLTAELTADDLPDDNKRYAVIDSHPGKVRVLCVDDTTAELGRKRRSGADLAVLALRGRQRDAENKPLQVDRIASTELADEKNLDVFDVILLANVADVAPEMADRLKGFVRRGGGLIFFLGDRVDPEVYNERFGSGEGGLLPGRLIKIVSAPEGSAGSELAAVKSSHSVAAVIKATSDQVINEARFGSIIQVEPAAGSETILSLAQPAVPLVLSHRVEDGGSVMLFTTSADRSWSNLPTHGFFTMLLQQAVTSLTSDPNARQFNAGEQVELLVTGRQVGDQVKLSAPGGQAIETTVALSGEKPVCAIEAKGAGFYEAPGDANIDTTAVAVNVDASESDVRVIDAGALSSQLDPLGARVVADSAALASAIDSSRNGRELAKFLLLLGVAIFLLQSFLAKYFTNRMSREESDVSATLQMSRVAAARRS